MFVSCCLYSRLAPYSCLLLALQGNGCEGKADVMPIASINVYLHRLLDDKLMSRKRECKTYLGRFVILFCSPDR